jgi:hypothetical protein
MWFLDSLWLLEGILSSMIVFQDGGSEPEGDL